MDTYLKMYNINIIALGYSLLCYTAINITSISIAGQRYSGCKQQPNYCISPLGSGILIALSLLHDEAPS